MNEIVLQQILSEVKGLHVRFDKVETDVAELRADAAELKAGQVELKGGQAELRAESGKESFNRLGERWAVEKMDINSAIKVLNHRIADVELDIERLKRH